MKIQEMTELKPGDLVRHRTGERIFVVTANYGNRVTAVASIDITNPHEWSLALNTASPKTKGVE